jgi:hypothetical protein
LDFRLHHLLDFFVQSEFYSKARLSYDYWLKYHPLISLPPPVLMFKLSRIVTEYWFSVFLDFEMFPIVFGFKNKV